MNKERKSSSPENGFDGLLDQIATPILMIDLHGTIVWANAACRAISGRDRQEMIKRPFWSFVADEAEQEVLKSKFSNLSPDEIPSEMETFCRSNDSTIHHVTWTNTHVATTESGTPLILATGVNITSSDEIESELSESKAFLRAIIDASPIAIVTIDKHGKILSFSHAATLAFGYEEADVLGQNVKLLMAEPDRSRHDNYLKHYQATGEKNIIGVAREVHAARRNGEQFPAMLHVSEFSNEQCIYVGFIEEISERKRTENQLSDLQSQLQHVGRLGAMGEIATAIAHELNQPLTAAASLAGAVSLMLGKTEKQENDEAILLLKDTVDEIRRASEVIRRMRDFIKTRKAAVSLQDVNKVIEDACTISLIGTDADGIQITKSLNKDVGRTRLDKIQIQQVVVNLIRNAIDAMQNSKEKKLNIATRRSDGFIEVTVSDTGEGMNADTKSHLFEPFFTTKEQGTGIGLSISRSIIDAHQGKIFVEDNNPTGCIFCFTIPIAESE